MSRRDLRRTDQLRPVRIERGYQRYPAGSALIETGHTRVGGARTVLFEGIGHRLGDGGVCHAARGRIGADGA